MPDFRVTWTIELEADNPTHAAEQALELLKSSDPDSLGLNFEVLTNVNLGAE